MPAAARCIEMAMKSIFGITLALATLVSCASQRDKDPAILKNRTSQSATQIMAETSVENFNFDSDVEYVGPNIELIEVGRIRILGTCNINYI